MGFFGNVVSAVVGAVAKVAKAVVNFFSPLAEKGGTVGSIASNVTNVAEAVLGVTAEVAEVTEDGEIDDEDIEEIIEEKFKLLVGAWIANFGSESSSDKKTDNANSSKGAVKKSFNSFKEIGNDIITSIKERTDKKCDSVYDFNNWMFFGIPGAVKSIWDSNGERGEKAFKSGSVYDYANWLSMGGGDMVKGAFNPEEQFSKEHWEDSFGVVSTIFGIKGYKGSKKSGILESEEINYIEKDIEGVSNAAEDTVTYRRVQGGTPPNASRVRINIDESGNISIPNKNANLNISTGNADHANYFLDKRGADAHIVEFDVQKWFDDFLNENAIPQKGYKSNPLNQGGTAPKIVDPTTPGKSYELPAPWIQWLEEYSTNGIK